VLRLGYIIASRRGEALRGGEKELVGNHRSSTTCVCSMSRLARRSGLTAAALRLGRVAEQLGVPARGPRARGEARTGRLARARRVARLDPRGARRAIVELPTTAATSSTS